MRSYADTAVGGVAAVAIVAVKTRRICDAQIHVDVPDRDEAVQVIRRVAPHPSGSCW